MTDAADATDRDEPGRAPAGLHGPIRLGIGLLQGLGLWWLYWSGDSYDQLCNLAEESRCPQSFGPATVP